MEKSPKILKFAVVGANPLVIFRVELGFCVSPLKRA